MPKKKLLPPPPLQQHYYTRAHPTPPAAPFPNTLPLLNNPITAPTTYSTSVIMPPKTIDEVIAEMEELQLAEHEPMFAIYQDLVTARKADIEKRAEGELERKKWEDEVISLQEEKERMEKERMGKE
ncbi:hypothetical protein B9479_007618 [Cryptococcus floricola]|uniref:Uncharacterized protein n=1 Tax=Cryptococcus floricola TaxID=2591691 RepID=A0A5D3ALZ4_9TREE|nr:hypothetical protein B9479_007618 [Cryptococcus floricola]